MGTLKEEQTQRFIAIKEDNILIAKFMGIKPKAIKRYDGITVYDFDWMGGIYNYETEEELWDNAGRISAYDFRKSYNNSWDCLMPVIDKIQETYETKDMYGAIIHITTTHVSISCKDFIYIEGKTEGNWKPFNIEAVYRAVVEFIKWYNKNNTLVQRVK